MSGEDAVRGFRYQFLCTLEYALRSWLSERDFEAVIVDASRAAAGSPADAEIVDFEIVEGGGRAVAAQVKGGVAGSRFTVADTVRVLQRLLTNDSDRYAVVTNRLPGPGLGELRELLIQYSLGTEPVDVLRGELLRLLSTASEALRQWVRDADAGWVDRLRRVDIVIDTRTSGEVDESVRELVRAARHRVDPGGIGWDAAGLISKYLVAVTLDAAAGDGSHRISCDDFAERLRVDPAVARGVLQSKEWAVHVTPAPRATDVARRAVLRDLAQALPTPVRDQTVPVCILSGLSGIGKSSIAAAWADDRADAYAEIFWIDASSAAGLATSFAYIAEWLAGQGLRAVGADARAKVFSALAGSARPWLMVFDNVGSPRETAQWMPPRGLGHVVLTTVRPRALSGSRITEVEVPHMTMEESVHLLALRLVGKSQITDAESDRLTSLARELNRWPLALEIAAAYLRNCLEGMAGLDEYERLIMRSLDDEDSVPHGYPNTLVRAIDLAWQQMVRRREAAYQHAVFALQCAGFAGSRQVPLQALLAAGAMNFDDILGAATSDGFMGYGLSDPPVGEVFRAMRSYSLITSDLPFVTLKTDPTPSPSSFGFTIQMNEIVQAIIRERLVSRPVLESAVNSMSAVMQHWLSAAHEKRIFDILQSLIAHAVALSEHAVAYGIENIVTGLLWGNTATVLHTLGYSELAVPYLRKELEFLRSAPAPLPIFRMQTAATLSAVIVAAADDTRTTADEVTALLEECLHQVGAAKDIDYNVTAGTVRTALATATALLPECQGHQRLSEVQEELEALVQAMPIEGRPDTFQEISEIGAMAMSKEYARARSAIEPLLAERDVRDPEASGLMRLLVECMVGLCDWSAAMDLIDQFADHARNFKNYQVEAGVFCRNVGIACLVEIIRERNTAAIEVFDAVVDLYEATIAGNQKIHLVNKSTGLLLGALGSCLRNDLKSADDKLSEVEVGALPKSGELSLLGLMHRMSVQLVRAVPPELVERSGSAALAVPAAKPATANRISRIPGKLFRFAIAGARPEMAPVMAVAATQWLLSGKRPARAPLEVVTELKYAMQALGFDAEVMSVTMEILRLKHSQIVDIPICTVETYAVLVDSLGAFVDPTVPHLAPRYRNRTGHPVEEEFPVVFPVCRGALQQVIHVPRSRHMIRYRDIEVVDLSAEWADRDARAHLTYAVKGLLTAISSAVEQFGLPSERLSEITSRHPQLRELSDMYRG